MKWHLIFKQKKKKGKKHFLYEINIRVGLLANLDSLTFDFGTR